MYWRSGSATGVLLVICAVPAQDGILGRRVLPKNGASVGIHRDGLAVGGGHEKHVVLGALHCDAVKVDGGSIHGAVELDLVPPQGGDVRGGDAGRGGRGAGAGQVPAKLGPIIPRLLAPGAHGSDSHQDKQQQEQPPPESRARSYEFSHTPNRHVKYAVVSERHLAYFATC